MLRFPGEEQYRVDSTPLAYALEDRHPYYRSIVPDDPGHAFLSHLLEDMADEWLNRVSVYDGNGEWEGCLLYTSQSPRDVEESG